MNLARIITRVALLGSALVLFAAAPAYAATARPAPVKAPTAISAALPASCTSQGAVVCIYASAGFSGGPGIFSGTNSSWGADFGSSEGACVAGVTAAPDNQGGWNDCVSSIANNTNADFYFYVNNNCTGLILLIAAHTSVSNLNSSSGGLQAFNDALSSDHRGTNAAC